MKKYLIDLDILVKFPKLLAHEITGDMIIPSSVLSRLETLENDRAKLLLNLIKLANKITTTHIAQVEVPDIRLSPSKKIDSFDYDIANFLKYLIEQGRDACLITDQKHLANYCQANNVPVMGSSDFFKLTPTATKDDIILAVEKSRQSTNYSDSLNVGVAFINIIVVILIVQNFATISNTLTTPFIIVILIFAGIYLFTLRQRFRLGYAINEIMVGVMGLITIFSPTFDISQIVLNISFGVKIAASLYVIVEGLDNLYKALLGSRFEIVFKKVLCLK